MLVVPGGQDTTAGPTPFEVREPGAPLHGTRADLAVDDLPVPGHPSNFQAGRVMNHLREIEPSFVLGASDFWMPRCYAHVIVTLRGIGGSEGTWTFFGARNNTPGTTCGARSRRNPHQGQLVGRLRYVEELGARERIARAWSDRER